MVHREPCPEDVAFVFKSQESFKNGYRNLSRGKVTPRVRGIVRYLRPDGFYQMLDGLDHKYHNDKVFKQDLAVARLYMERFEKTFFERIYAMQSPAPDCKIL